ncbi:MAG TPA: DNA mismatch repair protein MutS [Candidatus Tectomicrobia bacterium]
MAAATPMMQQYRHLKQQYPDAILLFRMGDFYEMFFEDACTAAPILDIALTARDKAQPHPTPMCGVPYHAVDSYIDRLLKRGFKVAICEQLEEPKAARGLVKRDVLRVVTPGAVMHSTALVAKENNFLAGLCGRSDGLGLAVIDVSTGEFKLTEFTGEQANQRAADELQRLMPRELLTPAAWGIAAPALPGIEAPPWQVTPREDWRFDAELAYQRLTQHFGTHSLEGFGCEDAMLAVTAAGVVLEYLQETQRADLTHIQGLSRYYADDFMALDATTQRHLELVRTMADGTKDGTVLEHLDQTVTAMGGRLLRRWLLEPLLQVEAICQRQAAVEALTEAWMVREEARELLKDVADIERIIGRMNLGLASPRDLWALRQSLQSLPRLADVVSSLSSEALHIYVHHWDPLADVHDHLARALTDDAAHATQVGDIFQVGYHAELDELRRLCTDSKGFLAALEAKERARTGIPGLRLHYNRVFGYYIEVAKRALHRIPPEYERRQTLVNAERFITAELKVHEERILGAEERMMAVAQELFQALQATIARETRRLQAMARTIASLDVLLSFAALAQRYGYVRPEMDAGEVIDIKAGRHPILEQSAEGRGFIPNDTYLDRSEQRVLIITGPNMAGKSTYLRQVALIVLLAQIGSFVPAERARIGVVDRIFTRIGAQDHLQRGQSTFMVEMHETANILHNATSRSLLILDEIGRGTSTYDGLSIAWAVIEHIASSVRARTLCATHYHELAELELLHTGVKNYHVAVRETPEGIAFLRVVWPGSMNRSYGIQVARLAGLPKAVVERAMQVLDQLTKQGTPPMRGKRRSTLHSLQEPTAQLALFDTAGHPLMDELRSLDITRMTPLEALTTLHRWQEMINSNEC